MVIASFPEQADKERLEGLLDLADSRELFLTVVLQIPRTDVTLQGARLRITHLLDDAAQRLRDTPWERPFVAERARVEAYSLSLRSGAPALFIATSAQAGVFESLWLPWARADQARFGPGVHALPLIDLLDQWEAVGIAMVARDNARIAVFDAMRMEAKDELASAVHRKHRAGGWAAARFERHIETQADRHLREAAREMETLFQRESCRRWFISGPPEAAGMFKQHLPHHLQQTLVGELSISSRASDEEVREKVLAAAQQVELERENAMVRELEERAQKGQGAVVGVARTVATLHPHQAHRLFLAAGLSRPATLCIACHALGPREAAACAGCGGQVVPADLGAELPNVAVRNTIPVEIVHGQAAELLHRYEGIGAFLKPPER